MVARGVAQGLVLFHGRAESHQEETASVHLRNHPPEVPPREVHDGGPERAARRGVEL